jgi:lipooligosaccharide transport system permease protein
MTTPALRYFETRAVVYRHTWRGSVITTFINPILYLAAMGIGLGTLVDEGAALEGFSYLSFLAPGLLAATAMQTAAGDASYPVMAGIKWARTFEAALATPIRIVDLVRGHLTWVTARIAFTSTVFAVVMAAFGAAPLGRSLLAVLPAVITGMAFAAPITAYTAKLKDPQGLAAMFRFGIIPMFLFSGTFFPITQLPTIIQPIAYVTPLWHGVQLCRAVALGIPTVTNPYVSVAYLLAWFVVGTIVATRFLRSRMVS